MSRFTVITGIPPPDTPKQRVIDRIKRVPKPSAMLQCPRCGCREVMETRMGAVLSKGKVAGGTKAFMCAACFMRGERVVLA